MSATAAQTQAACVFLRTPVRTADAERLDEIGAVYFRDPARPGAALLVHDDGSVLYADASVGRDTHLSEFATGRRTPQDCWEN